MTGSRSSDGFPAVLAMVAGSGSSRRRAAKTGITGHDTPAEHSGLALPHRRRRQLVPQPGEFAVAAPVTPGPDCPGSGPLSSGPHTREGTGKKRVLNGCTSVATATTAVHATSENVTDIQLCIAALAGSPLRTVVPIGGSARGYLGVGGASQQSRYGLLDGHLFCIFIHRRPWGECPHLPPSASPLQSEAWLPDDDGARRPTPAGRAARRRVSRRWAPRSTRPHR
jgi:hypothetical protein